MNKKYNIKQLLTPAYLPYALTVTLKQNEQEWTNYPNSLFYTNAKYINNNNKEIHCKVNKRTNQILDSFRIGMDQWASHFLQTTNITRNSHMANSPIIHYTIELMDNYKRRELVSSVKGSFGICPLHCHALVFVKAAMCERFKRYVGDDT